MTSDARRLSAAIAERELILRAFLDREKRQISAACHAMARAFSRGGTLLVFGTGAAETDAAHVAVEFMHPVIVGKRALPALAPPNDVFELMRPGDIAIGVGEGAAEFLATARRRGLLTLSFDAGEADFTFSVPTEDPFVRQEVQETTYHLLWELVHVFFEHTGLLDDACITCGDVAVEARVVAVRNGTAVIEKGGLREEVAVELVDAVDVGDVLLCHAGVALEKLQR
jgi:D-sedoheptulose 7-phosphate isomerase